MADPVDSTSTQSALPDSSKGGGELEETAKDAVLDTEQFPASGVGFAELASRFLGLVRFSHTLFALPFAALACVLALTTPGSTALSLMALSFRLVGVLLCMIFARSAAMAFNRLVDAKIDGANPRTASRHIPSGQLSKFQVWAFFAFNGIGFIASCCLFWPNWLPLLASVPVLAWICCYSFTKRFTSGAHIWLGVSLALSPICSWVAIRGEVVLVQLSDLFPAVALALAIAFWVAGFDVIYACQDADFDRDSGLNSIPARFGIVRALRISAVFHLAMLLVLCCLPWCFPQLSLSWLYWTGLAFVGALVIRQHAIVSPNDLRRVGEAFFTINIVISIGLSLVIALDSYIR